MAGANYGRSHGLQWKTYIEGGCYAEAPEPTRKAQWGREAGLGRGSPARPRASSRRPGNFVLAEHTSSLALTSKSGAVAIDTQGGLISSCSS